VRSPRFFPAKKRIPDRAWKTHDLRNRTIRLAQVGLALRGGYRELLRPKRRGQVAPLRGYRKSTSRSSASPCEGLLLHDDRTRAGTTACTRRHHRVLKCPTQWPAYRHASCVRQRLRDIWDSPAARWKNTARMAQDRPTGRSAVASSTACQEASDPAPVCGPGTPLMPRRTMAMRHKYLPERDRLELFRALPGD
jgi:Uncharacterized conserved protein (DUF2285)